MKKYFKLLIITLVLSLSIIGLTGCGKEKTKEEKNPIIGKWENKTSPSYVYTFNEDGTGDYSGVKFTYTAEDNNISITYESSSVPFKSTYEIKDNQLNIKDSFGNDTIYIKK